MKVSLLVKIYYMLECARLYGKIILLAVLKDSHIIKLQIEI